MIASLSIIAFSWPRTKSRERPPNGVVVDPEQEIYLFQFSHESMQDCDQSPALGAQEKVQKQTYFGNRPFQKMLP